MTAKRLMMLSILLSFIGIGLLLFSQSNSVQQTEKTPQEVFKRVLVSGQNIGVGQVYTPNMFRWKSVAENELSDYVDFITEEEFDAIHLASGIAHIEMKQDQILGAADLVPPQGGSSLALNVRRGFRAVSVPVDQVTANSGFVQPGDKVDILLLGSKVSELKKYDNLVEGLYVSTIATNVRILAFNNLSSSQGFQEKRHDYGAKIPDNSSVSLEVTPEQATQIVLANQLGRLTLSLRGASELEASLPASYTVTATEINPESKQVAPDVGLIQLRAQPNKN
ncbi:Flp pilus assembly protein CpaB [Vibrio ostreicida]|uniref:Flp pilus assembly protein CpaB n=1 Tax=Vibrio ostreicida TaxID=526588 RepID=A0ABT8C1Q5_9VIBR|nr:Flp pilus assembly protein CpaB [Vibrio ostreicida]MDN3612278.1 Flp pilus assembly protein CpaB [Vibrio ostreicida]NPD08661.1 Flp pilus assembly protein CpaB [Vibrio ostreicida]